ncbi:MAG: T9SS type A sorting domain-containing protein [bacterium]|nr:T9SS type A sorting domain-containing protein [bacterium]
MIKLTFSIILFSIYQTNLFGQVFIKPKQVYYFADTIPNSYYIQSIFVDAISPDSMAYQLNKFPNESWPDYSCMGMKEGVMGTTVLNQGNKHYIITALLDTFCIDYGAKDTFLISRNSLAGLKVYGIPTVKQYNYLLNTWDSIWEISLFTTDLNNNPIKGNPINQLYWRFSDFFGVIAFPNLKGFYNKLQQNRQLHLIGVLTYEKRCFGITNLNPQELVSRYIDLNIGDELHEQMVDYSSQYSETTETIRKITHRTDSPNYIIYTEKHFQYYRYFKRNDDNKDTIYEVNRIFERGFWVYKFDTNYTYFDPKSQFTLLPGYVNTTPFYYERNKNLWVYIGSSPYFFINYYFEEIDSCWKRRQHSVEPAVESIFYKGIGGPYYHFSSGYYNNLLYYKINNQVWGTPLISGIDKPNPKLKFNIFPNPANQILWVEVPIGTKGNFNLIEASGVNLLNHKFTKNFNLNLGNYKAGLYFGLITDEDGNMLEIKKIIISHVD